MVRWGVVERVLWRSSAKDLEEEGWGREKKNLGEKVLPYVGGGPGKKGRGREGGDILKNGGGRGLKNGTITTLLAGWKWLGEQNFKGGQQSLGIQTKPGGKNDQGG